ncbi:N-acetylmuramic acid 6-phosphate etherase [Gracilibacillus thailandensis]|uniref:N-acetylmuramic acid 6-phosphate etherase n=1 Tax=Gracilibacillus thailandensis TaxID=563735 RepID=A0A6N7R1Q8_9BACI|nr:N-acetylmuramic acid 6-phosphate etherase [Gracilibacillus thailandensis]MRI67210.1 N-acetylmuramic acid 6-phosphate etherase [Gracilibacillus thailandensis]
MVKTVTEAINQKSLAIDEMEAIDIVSLMLEEERQIQEGIQKSLTAIAEAVELIVDKWEHGARVFVVGAGTSGRIGVLDAVELGPTFSIEPDRWIAFVAGGKNAMWEPLEQHEDNASDIVYDLQQYDFNENDVLIAISASGSTPYSVAALTYAKEKQAASISISCNQQTMSTKLSDVGIELIVGPEVIRGSTRLKAGTAQKIAINMISTATMVKLGKVYQNEMIDMQLINKKLVKRAESMLMQLTSISEKEAQTLMDETNNDVKLSLIIAKTGCNKKEAAQYLTKANNHVKKAIQLYEMG